MLPIYREAADRIVAELIKDARIAGVAVGGSWLRAMDEYSDLDLIVAVYPESEPTVSRERVAIAERCGRLLAAFTGEHVGEPRLLICLYDSPLLHVDLKFVALSSLAERIEDPEILWQRGSALTDAMAGAAATYPELDRQWIEDRFWIWIHYTALKIGRGELFEAIDSVAFLRRTVLAPLMLVRAGHRGAGIRRLEQLLPDDAAALRNTLCTHERQACGRALWAAIDLYRQRRDDGAVIRRDAAERAATAFLDEILARAAP
jgi:hypothetical protein